MRVIMKATVLSVAALLVAATAQAQWSKDHVMITQYRPNGQSLPSRGVILGEYISGELNVLKGEDDDELVAKVKAFRASGTYTEPKANKKDEKVYLFCMFFKDDPGPAKLSDEERERLFIPDREQTCKEVDGSGMVRFRVPEHASYVMFTLAQRRATSDSRLESGRNIAYWSDELLLKKCGVAPFMGKLVEFSVKRPYRAEQVREAEESQGIRFVDCPVCRGTTRIRVPGGQVACPKCDGKGFYWRPFPRGSTGGSKKREKCEKCRGTGKITEPAHWEQCPKCRGTGKVQAE